MEKLDRLEEKLDTLKDDFFEFKTDTKVQLSELKHDLKSHMDMVKEHVAGDTKIINELKGLNVILPSLALIVKDYDYKREQSAKRLKSFKAWSIRLGFVSSVVGLASLIIKLLA
jgi:hypothetical protein